MDANTLRAIQGNRANRREGLRDNLAKRRRELHLIWKGKPLFYGWCAAEALSTCETDSIWEPSKPFGSLAL